MKRALQKLLRLLPLALLLTLSFLACGTSRSEKCLLASCSRYRAFLHAGEYRFRIILQADLRDDTLPTTGLHLTHWRKAPDASIAVSGFCFWGWSLDDGSLPGNFTMASVGQPATPWPINFAGIHATAANAGTLNSLELDHHLVLDLPFWFALSLPALLLALQLYKILRNPAGLLRRPGTCPACAYDLRSSPNCCPECGLHPIPHTPAPRERLSSILLAAHFHLRRHTLAYAITLFAATWLFLELRYSR